MDYSLSSQDSSLQSDDVLDWSEIDEWLHATLSKSMPYEKTPNTWRKLQHMMRDAKRKQSDAIRKSKMDLIVAEEYRKEANIYENRLLKLGIRSQDYEDMISLNALIDIAEMYQVHSPTTAAISAAIVRRSIEEVKCSAEIADTQEAIIHIEALLSDMSLMESRLRNATKKAEQDWSRSDGMNDKMQELERTTSILARKATEYRERLINLEDEFDALEIENDGLDNASLLADQATKKTYHKQIRELEHRLRTYKDLPPDIALASLKVEEAKAELDELARKRDDHFKIMANSVR